MRSSSSSIAKMIGAKQIGKQKGAYLCAANCATLSRPPTNLPMSREAVLNQHKHRQLHALRAVSSAQKQQFGNDGAAAARR